ncbi:MAG: thioredoxin domain-containing protein [Deltaproteobacteria bacterium]|nr:thioredoxin domain-containing protein [Deltaproteobacteria bacterium]
MKMQTNRLIHEKSPYLLQHAHNPVDWHPWGDEAFEKARELDKPVFLSIGYSTCHWCHVMERESFEDPQVAALMNGAFVSVKVDREERPDLDHVYMTVCQMLTGSGGWPLTLIMTPEKRPFFAATYIPRESRFGRQGMVDLIPRIKEIWTSRRDEVLQSAGSISAALREVEKDVPGDEPDRSVLDAAFEELAGRFDASCGGFGSAPKFPTPHNFLLLLRYWKRTGRQDALGMVEKTLREIRWGGVYDHIGFGFHRYSTDREWLVPHFEKMLYDQAMIALAYLETYQATGERLYEETAREIFEYVLRDLKSPEGGFYSAEDADSEGEEGKFYVWAEKEVRGLLDDDDADLACRVFHIEGEGNFREESTGESLGLNILHTGKAMAEIAEELGMAVPELERRVESIRSRLFEVRKGRIHPHKDDKILTDWNGLMIAALARGAQVLGDKACGHAAAGAVRFILEKMRKKDGRLFHRYREGEAAIDAHLDDYAFVVWGLIELYEATFDVSYLKSALDLNEDMILHFWDEGRGGLFFTADDGEELLVRKKEVYDGATPSGNSVAMHNLLRLARLTGRTDPEERAAALAGALSGQVRQYPSGYTYFLCAADFAIGPSCEVVIAGPAGSEETGSMVHAVRGLYLPNAVVLLRPYGEEPPAIDAVAEFLRSHVPVGGKATAYVCSGHTCNAPTTDIEKMIRLLES